jgi:hypothetical protein
MALVANTPSKNPSFDTPRRVTTDFILGIILPFEQACFDLSLLRSERLRPVLAVVSTKRSSNSVIMHIVYHVPAVIRFTKIAYAAYVMRAQGEK